MPPSTSPQKNFYIAVLAVLLFAGILLFVFKPEQKSKPEIVQNIISTTENATSSTSSNSKKINIEKADTDEKRILGLSGRTSLAPDTGLLFIFDRSNYWGFWMKDMKFPIDILWLDKDFKVVTRMDRVAPETYPEVFLPRAAALYVLEINAGASQEYNIHEGDIIKPLLNNL